MDSDSFFALSIVGLSVYMAINGLWSKEFYRIQRGGRRLAAHGIGCGVVAGGGVAALVTLEPAFDLGAAYLMMPLVYLSLLVSASALTRRLHGRLLILANANNMQDDETQAARFSDYALFLVVHAVPLILPGMMFGDAA